MIQYPDSAGPMLGSYAYFQACNKVFNNMRLTADAVGPNQKPYGYEELVAFTEAHLEALKALYPEAKPKRRTKADE